MNDEVHIYKYLSSGTNVEVPSTIEGMNVVEIMGSAFNNCTNLKFVFIPSTIETIGSGAFDNCSNATIYTDATIIPEGWSTSNT